MQKYQQLVEGLSCGNLTKKKVLNLLTAPLTRNHNISVRTSYTFDEIKWDDDKDENKKQNKEALRSERERSERRKNRYDNKLMKKNNNRNKKATEQ